MAGKVLSIEIGYSLTKVVEMDYNLKNPKVYKCFNFETPKGVLEDGVVRPSEEFRDAFESACEKNETKTKKAIFAVTSSRIANREVVIPAVKKNKIIELLRANASEYFPVDISKYSLAYNVVEELGNKADGKQYKLSVLAVPEELVTSYHELASFCGLTVTALDYTGNSLFQATKGEFESGTNLLIKLEENTSLLTVLNQGKVVLQRSIAYGISGAVETLRRKDAFGQNLSYSDAVIILRRESCIWSQLGEESDYDYIPGEVPKDIIEAKDEITEALSDLIRNIARIIDYHNSRSSEIPIKKVFLVGVGADINGLSRLITNELSLKALVLKQVGSVNFTKKLLSQNELSISQYIACIGATLSPVEFSASSIKSKKIKQGKGKVREVTNESLKTPITCLAAGAIIAVVLLGYPVFKKIRFENEKENLRMQIESMHNVKETYNKYLKTQVDYNELKAMYAATSTPNENILPFFEELEDKMPTSINVISMTASPEGIEMTINVDTMPAAAKVLVQLRTFNSLASVETTSLTTVEDETKKKTLEFTVNCLYKKTAVNDEDIMEMADTQAEIPDDQSQITQE